MALTTNKKNKIIAEWKAGIYENPSQVSKAHQISYKTAKKIISGISQSNAHLVEIQTALEIEKKTIKSPQEISAINREVEKRTNQEILDEKIHIKSRKILKKLLNNIESGISQGDYTDPDEILTGSKAIETIVKTIKPTEKQNINLSQSQGQLQEQKTLKVEFIDENS